MAGTEELPTSTAMGPVPSAVHSPSLSYDNTTFTIGSRRVSRPLVSIEQLKSHLRLLGIFAFMKQKVESPDSDPRLARTVPLIAKALTPEERWVWFLELAVERFQRWVTTLNIRGDLVIPPPIDVWIIWHAYMLSPMWYAEDCERLPLLQALRNLKDSPIDLVANVGDDPFNFRPPPEQEEIWDAHVKLPYNPFISCDTHTCIDIKCPRCEKTLNVPFLNTSKAGFAQANFDAECRRCSFSFAREGLGVAKFARDAVLDPDNNIHSRDHGKAIYLPGTLLMASGLISTSAAKEIKVKLGRMDAFSGDNRHYPILSARRRVIAGGLRYEATELRKNLEGCLTAPRVRRVLGAYVDGKLFSVELVAAAMMQMRFTEKMHQLGWLDPGFFDNTEGAKALQHCVARYYGFLTLVQGHGSFFVPTLDIDLAWHTHQLSPKAYKRDCITYVGKFVDHEDQVEESFLSDRFDLTCRAWESQFGIPYAYCGCPLPGTTIGRRLRTLSAIMPSHRARMDPPMDREDCYSATHPSDHNSVFTNSEVNRQRREVRDSERKRRRERDGQKIKESEGKAKSKDLKERYARGEGHDAAFMVPVSSIHTHGYGNPYGYPQYPRSCAGAIVGSSGGNGLLGHASSYLSCSGGGCGRRGRRGGYDGVERGGVVRGAVTPDSVGSDGVGCDGIKCDDCGGCDCVDSVVDCVDCVDCGGSDCADCVDCGSHICLALCCALISGCGSVDASSISI